MTHSCWTNELPRNIFSIYFPLNFLSRSFFQVDTKNWKKSRTDLVQVKKLVIDFDETKAWSWQFWQLVTVWPLTFRERNNLDAFPKMHLTLTTGCICQQIVKKWWKRCFFFELLNNKFGEVWQELVVDGDCFGRTINKYEKTRPVLNMEYKTHVVACPGSVILTHVVFYFPSRQFSFLFVGFLVAVTCHEKILILCVASMGLLLTNDRNDTFLITSWRLIGTVNKSH